MQQPKPLLVRVKGYQPGEDGINVMVCLGPNTDKAKFERFLGEENPILFLGHPPAEVLTSNKKPQLKGGAISKLAGQWCKDEKFFEFLLDSEMVFVDGTKEANSIAAKRVFYIELGISSLKEIDHNKDVEKSFNDKFRFPFMHWQKEKGYL